MDDSRNTPLHIIVGYQRPIKWVLFNRFEFQLQFTWCIKVYKLCYLCSDFTTLHSIIMDLLEAGAHIDTVNSKGLTPTAMAATGMVTKFWFVEKNKNQHFISVLLNLRI